MASIPGIVPDVSLVVVQGKIPREVDCCGSSPGGRVVATLKGSQQPTTLETRYRLIRLLHRDRTKPACKYYSLLDTRQVAFGEAGSGIQWDGDLPRCPFAVNTHFPSLIEPMNNRNIFVSPYPHGIATKTLISSGAVSIGCHSISVIPSQPSLLQKPLQGPQRATVAYLCLGTGRSREALHSVIPAVLDGFVQVDRWVFSVQGHAFFPAT